ncbi:MAG: hypothetical protein DRP93_01320 [Candidatus Neomarinimicrobiota bacterium]|nr:MAG: hypothetical protein DRP93_01320 [Candidatus Neomarinimicrobiota bacterium]
MAGGKHISNFSFIVEAMPFRTYKERLVHAVGFCRNMAGVTLAIPNKQCERALAKELIKSGVDFLDVKELVFLHIVTINKIVEEVSNEQQDK